LPLVNADPMALESIFGNLITNAINYTPNFGHICVSAHPVPNGIQVDVTDTGFGIEARHLDQIFKRFFRVKNEKTRFITGTGLEYISSAGLRSILVVAKKLKIKNGKIILAGMEESVHEVFEISGFNAIIPIVDTVDAAVNQI